MTTVTLNVDSELQRTAVLEACVRWRDSANEELGKGRLSQTDFGTEMADRDGFEALRQATASGAKTLDVPTHLAYGIYLELTDYLTGGGYEGDPQERAAYVARAAEIVPLLAPLAPNDPPRLLCA